MTINFMAVGKVGHWRGKLVFLSVQVIHIVLMEWLELELGLYRDMRSLGHHCLYLNHHHVLQFCSLKH